MHTDADTLAHRRRRLFIWPDDFSLMANLYYSLRFFVHVRVCWVSDSHMRIRMRSCVCSLSGVGAAAAATDPLFYC